MPTIKIERRVNAPVERLLDLLAEPESYPRFLPGVREVDQVEVETSGGVTSLKLRALLKFTVISGRIAVLARIDRKARAGRLEVVKGPFSMARGSLTLAPVGDATTVTAVTEYATPIDAFHSVIEQKLGLLADLVVTRTQSHVLQSA